MCKQHSSSPWRTDFSGDDDPILPDRLIKCRSAAAPVSRTMQATMDPIEPVPPEITHDPDGNARDIDESGVCT